MSSGQKAWAEELEQEGREAHKRRLEALGLNYIANVASDLRKEFQLLESSLETLPRNGWLQLDRIKDLINRLN